MKNYKHTIYASYIGYITQAIVNNFAPLLFIMFASSYSISLDRITLLVTVNFGIQLIVDFLAAKFVDCIGCRISIVTAHVFAAMGLSGLGFLPEIMPDPYIGILISVVLYAIGGGLIEVLVSPIVEACPTDEKSAAMSLLHSFYCWGHVMVVVLSTLFFRIFGINDWRILAGIWAVIPLANAVYFTRVPLYSLDSEETGNKKRIENRGLFVLFILLMICAGASEQAMSQWVSAFAESALGISKTVGDLAGPCMFAIFMGISRVFYSHVSEKTNLTAFMTASGMLCIATYIAASVFSIPSLSLAACGLCGLSVGILWPGTFSLAASAFPSGGTAMFAFLALAGDFGCMAGPTITGIVSNTFNKNMKAGFIAALIFPVVLVIGIRAVAKNIKVNSEKSIE